MTDYDWDTSQDGTSGCEPSCEPGVSTVSGTHRRGALGGAVALVAEPDRDLQSIYAKLLHREGARDVVCVSTGTDALAHALAHPPDVVVTELRLPNLDGIAFVRRLRSEPRTRAAFIVVVTAQRGALLAHHARELGVATVLSKPVALSVLAAILRGALDPMTGLSSG